MMLVAGIFFFDTFAYTDAFLYGALAVCLLLWGVSLWFHLKPHRRIAAGFSWCIYPCCFLLGGALVLQQKQVADRSWTDTDAYYTGTILSATTKAQRQQWSIRLDTVIERHEGKWMKTPLHHLVQMQVDTLLSTPAIEGRRIGFYSRIYPLSPQPPFFTFDYHRYLRHKGYSGTGWLRHERFVFLTPASSVSLSRMELYRRHVSRLIHSWQLSPKAEGIVLALTVGDKSGMDDDTRATYRRAGAAHILALSGLHVGIIVGLLVFIFRPLQGNRFGKGLSILIVNIALWFYALLTGASPSVVRAVGMFSLYSLARIMSEEKALGLHILTMMAFGLLMCNPYLLFDISFQLSFAAVASILLFYPAWSVKPGRLPRYLLYPINLMVMSISAQVLIFPLSLYYFGTFPLYFLLTNLLVIPLTGIILPCICLCLPLSFFGNMGQLSIRLLQWLIDLMNQGIDFISHLTYAQIEDVHIDLFQLAIIYCFIAVWTVRCRQLRWIAALIIVNLFIGYGSYRYFAPMPQQLYLYGGKVYTSAPPAPAVVNGIYQLNQTRIAVLNSGQWRYRKSNIPLTIDYAYFCNGFRGRLRYLTRLFKIRRVVIDSRMSPTRINQIIDDCQELKIPYFQLDTGGYYPVKFQ